MAEAARQPDGLEVQEMPLHAATLRYFGAAGPFAAAVAAVTATPPPAPLTALVVPEAAGVGAGIVLAWLRPTETLALSEAAAPLAGLKEALAKAAGGHVVDLSGGLKAFRMRGARVADLLSRLGSAALGMGPGHARRGRFGDLPVLALSVRPGEVLLVVDRAFAAHLGGWIEATLADWA
jgi:sarcosine oxidase gamma subunit